MTGDRKDTGAANEGEGSRSGARAYNQATKEFVDSGRVGDAAQQAKKAVEGGEKAELERAEAEGKRHAKGEDPALRDGSRGAGKR
jgi:hypothetical protein